MAIDNKQLLRRFTEEIWNKANFEAIDELCDPSYEARDPMIGTYARDGLKETVKAYRSAFPDLKLEIVGLISEGNLTAVRWTARGTNLGSFMGMPPTGKSTVVTGIAFSEVRNGKVVKDYNEYDALGLLRQLGVDPKSLPMPVTQKQPELGRHV